MKVLIDRLMYTGCSTNAKSQYFSATARASWEHKELLRVYNKITVSKARLAWLADKKKVAKGKAKRDSEQEYKELMKSVHATNSRHHYFVQSSTWLAFLHSL